MAYLDDHPPRQRQFKARGVTASGVLVIHTAESVPDTIGIDEGAEGVAAFIAARSDFGSYHRLCDSDGVIPLVRFDQQAYGDGTGSNPHAIHISAATQAARWPSLPKDWIEATVRNMARAAHEASDYIFTLHGVRIPARRVSRAESDRRVEGFISHAERDPARRTDPGSTFPWDMLFDFYSDLERGQKPDIKPKPTRGENIDHALMRIRRALNDLDDAKGPDPRMAKIDQAEDLLHQAQKMLRSVSILNKEKNS